MRALLTVEFHGATSRKRGSIVEGDEAVRMVKAGYAVPIKEEAKVEVADAPEANVETRKRRSTKKAD